MKDFKASHTQTWIASHIVDFLSKPNPFIRIGQPISWKSPYSDELIPEPEPKYLGQAIAYIKPKLIQGVYRSPCGGLFINNVSWSVVDLDSITIENGSYKPLPTHLYIRVDISPDFYNTDSFRSIALYTHTSLVESANLNLVSYEPSYIKNPGLMHWMAVSKPITRLQTKTHKLDILI